MFLYYINFPISFFFSFRECVETLLDHNAKVIVFDDVNKRTPLHAAGANLEFFTLITSDSLVLSLQMSFHQPLPHIEFLLCFDFIVLTFLLPNVIMYKSKSKCLYVFHCTVQHIMGTQTHFDFYCSMQKVMMS